MFFDIPLHKLSSLSNSLVVYLSLPIYEQIIQLQIRVHKSNVLETLRSIHPLAQRIPLEDMDISNPKMLTCGTLGFHFNMNLASPFSITFIRLFRYLERMYALLDMCGMEFHSYDFQIQLQYFCKSILYTSYV
ncbi:uncharacterized protein LOC111240904 [Vigna radiata var. radiata]|uniref:Uncharacterized protein LOC111240904 n=1 Tax=Vigna radiata var. radiata TaxID=3916 RepID=A0A3Q0ER13_VIGRR|nr:uncharacterized protein LOC111240904 [Vigna radiata var. radiata]